MKSLIFIYLVSLVACQSPTANWPEPGKDTIPATAVLKKEKDTTTLAGSWYLQPVLASDTAAGRTPTLVFDTARSRFSGFTGCNTMHGSFFFSGKDSSLSFGEKILTTRMACPGYNEPAFIKSLKNATHFRLQMGVLVLLAEDNSELSRWMRKPATNAPLKA